MHAERLAVQHLTKFFNGLHMVGLVNKDYRGLTYVQSTHGIVLDRLYKITRLGELIVCPIHIWTDWTSPTVSVSLCVESYRLLYTIFRCTGWSKKAVPQFYFCDNFRKCRPTPILIVFHR